MTFFFSFVTVGLIATCSSDLLASWLFWCLQVAGAFHLM